MDRSVVTVTAFDSETFESECANLVAQGYKLFYVRIAPDADGSILGNGMSWVAVMAKQEALPVSAIESLVNPYP